MLDMDFREFLFSKQFVNKGPQPIYHGPSTLQYPDGAVRR
jgi:hypothetical protein